MEDLNDVYNELIMEHSMNSYNKKKLEKADYCEVGHNPNCGDEITLELKLYGFFWPWLRNITSINIHYDRCS